MVVPTPAGEATKVLLQLVWTHLLNDDAWPSYGTIDRELYREHSISIDDVLANTSEELIVGGRAHRGRHPAAGDQLRLTPAGVKACAHSDRVLSLLADVVVKAVIADREHKDGSSNPTLSADQVIEGASNGVEEAVSPTVASLARQVGLLLVLEPWVVGSSLYEGGWTIQVGRSIRAYVGTSTFDDYWNQRQRQVSPQGGHFDGSVDGLPSGPVIPSQAATELARLREEAKTASVQQDGPEHDAWKAKVNAVMTAALGRGSTTLARFRELTYHIGLYSGAPGGEAQDAAFFIEQVERASAIIAAAIYELGLSDETQPEAGRTKFVQVDSMAPIFIVHGRNGEHKYRLARLLDRATRHDVRILHEQANRGATAIEKLERHAQDAGFAVILITGDDEGRLKGEEELQSRGRQNVILELGIFLGLLGRSRVAVLIETGVERPSDIEGLIYIPIDPAGAWQYELLKELESAGIQVDRTRVP